MPALHEEVETPSPLAGRTRFNWLRENGSRIGKYFVLIIAIVITLKVVLDAYSYYVARRDIDSELRSKKIASLEYISVLSQRKRALAITALEGRCSERLQLAMFRIFDAQQDRIKEASANLYNAKSKMLELIGESGNGLIDVEKAKRFVNFQDFNLAQIDEYIRPISSEIGAGAKYKKFMDDLNVLRQQYDDVAKLYGPLLKEVEDYIKTKNLSDSKHWNMESIRLLSDRNEKVRQYLQETKDKLGGGIEELLARYGVWTAALTGGAGNNPVLDDMAYIVGKADDSTLKDVDCNLFKDYYAAVNDRLLTLDPLSGKTWHDLTIRDILKSPLLAYERFLVSYFSQPPAAQTLFVTLTLGALGAMTLNLLRLSNVGWWALRVDPTWGDVFAGPVLGALAAFGIFLLGSTGLLLTTESGSQPLSGYFIGLLGFISGLLYDEAFGRVRRVGEQFFAPTPDDAIAHASAEDRSLAETLRGNSAALIADLVVKFGLGKQLSIESEFTLLVPTDEAVGHLPLATWNDLNKPEGDLWKKWLAHHYAEKRVTRSDAVSTGTAAVPIELKVKDGTPYILSLEGSDFKINNVRVLIANLSWKNGIIHILSAELP